MYEVDPNTLTINHELDVAGAHGIWGNEQENFLYVGDITSNGADAIYTIDIETFEITAVSDAVLPASHNLMVSIDNSKLFVTHSGGAGLYTSIYDLDDEGVPHNGRFVETGATPFGIMLIRDPQS